MKSILTTIFSILTLLVSGQTSKSGDIEIYIDNLITNMPSNSGNDFIEPSAAEFIIWESTIEDILLDDMPAADVHANSIGYEIILFTDNTVTPNKLYYILERETSSMNYWGTYVFNPTACRPTLIIQSPHPEYDTNTGNQGIYCFKNTDAKAFCISGTHRCNNSNYTTCSGTSSVCSGASSAFQISDLPHNTNTVFQKTTEILYNDIANSVFIQLHGFGKKSTDPYVILSNGSRSTPSGTDYAVAFQNALFAEDNLLTFKVAHVDLTWTRLIGFTNTQGRLLNGENTPCTSSASATTGRFIHLEQEKSRLREDASTWVKVSNALANTFTCVALPVELSSFEVLPLGRNVSLEWTTRSEENNDYFIIEKSIDSKNWQAIGQIDGNGNSLRTITYKFVDKHPFDGVNYYRIKQVDFDENFEYSMTKIIVVQSKNDISIFPNPSTGQVFIQTNTNVKRVLIYNNLGQLVQKLGSQIDLQIIYLPKGSYNIQVISDQGVSIFQQIIH